MTMISFKKPTFLKRHQTQTRAKLGSTLVKNGESLFV